MNENFWRVCNLAERQHRVVATWQLRRLGLTRAQIVASARRLRQVHRGVYSIGDLEELGWYMAAALALGPAGLVSHLSALMLLGLRPHEPGDIQDADLAPHELYRALEEAERSGHDVHLLNGVVRLRQAVRGRTRSDAEARFILLCHEHRLPLPLVNHRLNGIETDFHWPRARLVVEVDGYEFHHLKEQFEEDRRRGLVHAAAGYTVIRVSAKQVQHAPALIARALRQTTGW